MGGLMSGETGKWQGMILAVTAAVLWGVSGAFAQFLIERRGTDAEWLVGLRMLSAGILMLGFSALSSGKRLWSVWKNRQDAGQLMLFSLFGMLAVQYTYFTAIQHSNAATATVLQFAGPVMIAVWLSLRLRRWPQRRETAAIALAAAGMLLLVTHGKLTTLAISGAALFWGLTSAAALAFYSLQPVRLLGKYPAAVLTGWAMLIGGTVVSFVKPVWKVSGVWDQPAVLAMGFIVIFGTLTPFQCYLLAVRRIGGQTTSLLLSAEPLSATIASVVWLSVPFALPDWAGTACILSTVFLLAKSKPKATLQVPSQPMESART